jgi:hypothetical protein
MQFMERISVLADPYISEFKGANELSTSDTSKDFIEVVVDKGSDVSNLAVITYKGGATSFRDQYLLTGKTPTQKIAGKDVYLLDNTNDGFFLLVDDGIALVEANDTGSYPLQVNDISTVFQAITDGRGFVGSGGCMDGVSFIDVTPGNRQDIPSLKPPKH